MAGNAADIKAGSAFVQLWLDKSPFTKGLTAAANELRAIGKTFQDWGLKLAAVGAAITVPLVAAAKGWAESGTELLRMSQRTGVAVEALSAYRYAAKMTDVELTEVEGGIKRLQRTLVTAAEGSLQAQQSFQRLGLQWMDFKNLNPQQQFELVAAKLAAIEDPTKRDALAMGIMGRSATTMMPMLMHLAELRKQAGEMGAIASPQDVAAAEALSHAYKLLEMAFVGVRNAVGSALGPALTRFTTWLAEVVKHAGDFIRQHQDLVVLLFRVGSALGTAGMGLMALGTSLRAVAPVFDLLSTALGKTTDFLLGMARAVLGPLWSALKSALMLLPALAGKVWDLATGLVSMAVDGLKSAVSGMFDLARATAKTTFALGGLVLQLAETAWYLLDSIEILSRMSVIIPDLVKTISAFANGLAQMAISASSSLLGLIPAVLTLGATVLPLVVLGFAFSALYSTVRALGEGLASLSFAGPVQEAGKTVAAVVSQVRGDIGALTGAFRGFGGYFTGWGDLVKGIFKDVSAAALRLFDDAKNAFQGIQDAMATGDRKALGAILEDSLTIAWGEIGNVLGAHWSELIEKMTKAAAGIWYAMREGAAWLWMELDKGWSLVSSGFEVVWAKVLRAIYVSMEKMLLSLMKSDNPLVEPVRQAITAMLTGLDAAAHPIEARHGDHDALDRDRREYKQLRRYEAAGGKLSDGEKARLAELEKIRKASVAGTSVAGQEAANREKAANEDFAAGTPKRKKEAEEQAKTWSKVLEDMKPGTPQAEIDAARKDLEEQRKKLAAAREKQKKGLAAPGDKDGQGGFDPKGLNVKGTATVTNSAVAAGMMAAPRTEQQMVSYLKLIEMHVRTAPGKIGRTVAGFTSVDGGLISGY